MAIIKRTVAGIEPTLNAWQVLIDVDPRNSPGLVLGVGSLATDEAGNVYKKTSTGATNWTLVAGSNAGDADSIAHLRGVGAPTSGVSGTGAGAAGHGSDYRDTTSGDAASGLYVNIGTKAAPSWAQAQLGEAIP